MRKSLPFSKDENARIPCDNIAFLSLSFSMFISKLLNIQNEDDK